MGETETTTEQSYEEYLQGIEADPPAPLPQPEVVWQDPPVRRPSVSPQNHWHIWLAPFVQSPHTWGLARRFPGRRTAERTAYNLRRGIVPINLDAKGEWEFTSRLAKDGEGSELYARFTPTSDNT